MMKVLTLIVSAFILIPRSDAHSRPQYICGCKPAITKICANNGKTYDSVCAMNCDENYVNLYMVSYGACEDNSPIPIPINGYPPSYQPDQYQPDQYQPNQLYPIQYNVPSPPPSPTPPPYRLIYYPPPQNIHSGPLIGASRPLAGSASPHAP